MVPPAPIQDVEMAGVDEDDDDSEIVEEATVEAPGGKRTRTTRKFTLWNFVSRIDATNSFCKCGCLDNDGIERKKYFTGSTGNIKRHVAKLHPTLLTMFEDIKTHRGNITQLLEKIEELDGNAIGKAAKKRRNSDRFWTKALDIGPAVVADLRLLMWSIANGISRNSLNDILFDAYLKSIGAQAATNRHTLQEQHLPILDQLVRDSHISDLKDIMSAAISSDGWRDKHRRDFINVVIAFIKCHETKKLWLIKVVEPDLIFLPTSATADTIAYLINNVLNEVVLF